jgi:hypothetical protein
MTTQEMQARFDHAIAKADGIVSAAERQKRPLTTFEEHDVDDSLKEASVLKPQIAATKTSGRSTAEIRAELNKMPRQPHLATTTRTGHGEPIMADRFSR